MRNQCWSSKLPEKGPFHILYKILRSRTLGVSVMCVLREKQVFAPITINPHFKALAQKKKKKMTSLAPDQ